ncbi:MULTISPECIES: hypothetical protein [unclassified Streptomyces]|uniref:hypothetical protein n=1 Tax=unclassified Streptomyces TaxID=2593676 RepID=UPI002E2BD647|nr:hypothetical protein [Streptomyces sp. NBC_00223]
MKRMTFTAAAALLALAAFQGRAAADSTPGDGTGTGAPGLWQPSGAALTGADTTADAPAMKPAESYRDTIGPGETKFYGIALDAKESAYASAFAVPPSGSRVAYGDGIELKLLSADGSNCDSADAHFQDDGNARPIGTAVARTMGVGSSCQDANQYTLQVHRNSAGTSDPGGWPLELRYVLEPALEPGTAAEPAPAFGTASPTPLTTGTPRQARGGTDFTTAAAVRTGIWKDGVLPGETRFYKVPVDWGQQATVFADFSSAKVNDASTYVGSGVRLTAYSPVRQLIDGVGHSYQGTPTSLNERIVPVSYVNRAASDSKVERVRYAGWYYFAVTVHPDVAQAVQGAVPVTLRVEVAGAAQAPPAYDGDPGTAGIGVDAHDVSSANGTATGGGSSSSGPLRFLAFAALGAGTVLVLSLGVWTLGARRRAAAARASAGDSVPPTGFGGPPPAW